MTTGQVLLVGGSGNVGRAAVTWLRERHPGVPLLIGGRNLQAASDIAQEAGGAEAAAIDLDAPHLGLGDDVDVAAVVMLAPEAGLEGLGYAQDLGVPFLNIANHLAEVGPEMALFAHRATAAPVVLASHWLGGAALFLAQSSARPSRASAPSASGRSSTKMIRPVQRRSRHGALERGGSRRLGLRGRTTHLAVRRRRQRRGRGRGRRSDQAFAFDA